MLGSALALLAAAAPLVSARAISTRTLERRSSNYGNVVYWGQNDNERSLASYCAEGQDIDILLVSFLDNFGNGIYPNGQFGDSCTVGSDQSVSGCDKLAGDIQTCQNAGVKVFISLGGSGADDTWYLTGTADAAGVAYSLWNSYANPAFTNGTARPFGNVTIDGWDFDIESRGGSGFPDSYEYLGDLVNSLRGYFKNDTSNHTYYISGAPECPAPDKNMNVAIQSAQFDYLWIQFYNNDCSANDLFNNTQNNPDSAGTYNFNVWPGTISNGTSSKAKLYVGISGSPDAATPYDWVHPENLNALVNASYNVTGFSGMMIYDAGASDSINVNGSNYVQLVQAALNDY